MEKAIRLFSNWYSKNELEFLLGLLKQQETTDKMESGHYVFDYCGSTFTLWVDSECDIMLLSIGYEL